MEGPSAELRQEIASRLDEIAPRGWGDEPYAVTRDGEAALEEILGEVEFAVHRDVRGAVDVHGRSLLEMIDAWAGLASYVVGRFYGPASPWPRGLGGWSRGAVLRLRSIAEMLTEPLRLAAQTLGANSYSVTVSFPWGVSVSLAWSEPNRQMYT